jgi:putative hydrolase of the HAD superfamily
MRLGIISNWDSRLRALLNALALANEFETVVISCEAGVEKPDRAIFERALANLGLSPHEAFHIGDDRISDFEGPRAAGMAAALVVRKGPAPEGVQTVDSLTRLLDFLG